MSILPGSQNKRRALYRNLLFALVGVVALLALIGRMTDIEVHGATTAVVIVVTLVSVLQFGALDEMARQAHFTAWYWGSTLALLAIGALGFGLVLDLLPFARIEAAIVAIHGSADMEASFLMGLLTGPILMAAGFVVWCTIHWLRMR
jgi:hypothetical protein